MQKRPCIESQNTQVSRRRHHYTLVSICKGRDGANDLWGDILRQHAIIFQSLEPKNQALTCHFRKISILIISVFAASSMFRSYPVHDSKVRLTHYNCYQMDRESPTVCLGSYWPLFLFDLQWPLKCVVLVSPWERSTSLKNFTKFHHLLLFKSVNFAIYLN